MAKLIAILALLALILPAAGIEIKTTVPVDELKILAVSFKTLPDVQGNEVILDIGNASAKEEVRSFISHLALLNGLGLQHGKYTLVVNGEKYSLTAQQIKVLPTIPSQDLLDGLVAKVV